MPDLDINTEEKANGVTLLKLAGYLDAHTFESLDESINALFDEDKFKLLADLSQLEYISSAGAGVFIGALAEAQENGGNIILAATTPNVYEVFDLLGLTQIFTMAESIDAGLGSF